MFGYADTLRRGLDELRELEAERAATLLRITRGTGEASTDPTTGKVTSEAVLVWEGYGRIARADLPASEPRPYAARHYETVNNEVIRVPVGTPAKVGDQVEIIDDPDTPANIGQQFTIQLLRRFSQGIADRITCQETQQG